MFGAITTLLAPPPRTMHFGVAEIFESEDRAPTAWPVCFLAICTSIIVLVACLRLAGSLIWIYVVLHFKCRSLHARLGTISEKAEQIGEHTMRVASMNEPSCG